MPPITIFLGILTGIFATSGLTLQFHADTLDAAATPPDPFSGTYLTGQAHFDRNEIRVLRRSRQRSIARRITRLSAAMLYLSVVAGLGISFPPVAAYALFLCGIIFVLSICEAAQLSALNDAERARDARLSDRYRQTYGDTIPPQEGLTPIRRGPSFIGKD